MQTLANGCTIIKEKTVFKGIPFAEYFNVNSKWVFDKNSKKDTNNDNENCHVSIYSKVLFTKKLWVQGMIESNTKSELLDGYKLWDQSVQQTLELA